MEALKDIKGFVEVPDDSFFYLMLTLGGVALVVVTLVLLFLWLRKPKRRSRRLTPEQLAKMALKTLDFSDTKEAVYNFSEHAQRLNSEHPALLELLPKLEVYKFRREVPTLTKEDEESMRRIVKELTHG